jgi:hypothetical protein
MLSPFDLHFILGVFDNALGARALFFSMDLARGVNRFSVKFYEVSPPTQESNTPISSRWFPTELQN